MNDLTAFKDIIKKNFIDNNSINTLNSSDIFINLVFTLIIALFIFYIYRKSFQGVLYTQAFNVSLVMVALITCLVIMTISTNLILSLGMVGALSIVRFRTAIKDSMDIGFMFWAISIGIANGAGYFKISFFGSIFIAIVLFLLSKYRDLSSPYLLIINYSANGEESLKKYLAQMGAYKLKSKTVTSNNIELTIEIRTNNDHKIVSEIQALDNIDNCVLISYNGDYVS
jgi:hypothetical protein